MKNLFKYLFIIGALVLFATACSKNKFADYNTDPDGVLSVPPEYELSTALYSFNSNGNERYYDYYLGIYYWDQTFVLGTGNSINSYQGSGNIGQRWSIFYGSVGAQLMDIKQKIKKLPVTKQAAYAYLNAITTIPMAYYAWYTSDVYGSEPYTQALLARYTIPALLAPVYDTQEALFDTLDNQLKAAITVLETQQTTPQTNLAGYDLFYNGNVTQWIKAANSLRLKIAFRLMKRNPAKLQSVATEVFSDQVGPILSSADNWQYIGINTFTGTGDNPSNQRPVSGAKNLVDFMWKTQDPRIGIFFQPSPLTKDMYDSAKAQGQIPTSFVWDGQLYRGQYVSPDASQNPANAVYFTTFNFSYQGQKKSITIPSPIQSNFFNSNPQGSIVFPIITCADVCFMKAELAQRGLYGAASDAQTWYYKGIDSSLSGYDQMATIAKIPGYTKLTQAQATAYKAQPGVIYDPNNALEQISVQQYLNYYKNNSEAWAVIKRTGFPSTSGNIMPLEPFYSAGTLIAMPRRFAIPLPLLTDLNYQNENNAISQMQKDPGFGNPSDITGRVWWDTQ